MTLVAPAGMPTIVLESPALMASSVIVALPPEQSRINAVSAQWASASPVAQGVWTQSGVVVGDGGGSEVVGVSVGCGVAGEPLGPKDGSAVVGNLERELDVGKAEGSSLGWLVLGDWLGTNDGSLVNGNAVGSLGEGISVGILVTGALDGALAVGEFVGDTVG